MSLSSITNGVPEAALADLKELCRNSTSGTITYEFLSGGWKECSRHYLTSSSDYASIAIQPGSTSDLAIILQIIRKYRVPFAVKGGGHSMVPGFSSTYGGLLISMTRFDDLEYDEASETIQVGAGCLWGAVYHKTAHYGRCVVGGANPAVGVAGFTLGGGYSLKTNRLGLAIDHVKAFEIVTPGGVTLEVSDKSQGGELELYQALRGGANNFGIATKFTLATHPQTVTYGAMLVIPGEKEAAVKKAIIDHVENEKRKEAALEIAFKYVLTPGKPTPDYSISAYCVFDAPKPKNPADVPYKAFREIVKDSWEFSDNPVGWDPVWSAVDGYLVVAPPAPVEGMNVDFHDLGFRQMSFGEMHVLSDHAYHTAAYGRQSVSNVIDVPSSPNLSEAAQASLEAPFPWLPLLDLLSDIPGIIMPPSQPIPPSNASSGKTLASVLADIGSANKEKGVELAVFAPGAVLPTVQPGTAANGASGASSSTSSAKKAAKKNPLGTMANLGEMNIRGRFACIMVSGYTEKLVEAVARETERCSKFLLTDGGRQTAIEVWPFLPSIFDNSPPGAAWPHNPGDPHTPLIASFQWDKEEKDEFWLALIREALDNILQVALAEGVAREDMPRYLNTSCEDIPVEMVYGGKENVERLGKIRRKWDEEDVMSLTGGFKIPLA